jgi:hypothetical protein
MRASMIIMTTTPPTIASQDQIQPTVRVSTTNPTMASSQVTAV